MNDDERRIISDFVARIAGAAPAPATASPWGGSVPATQPRPQLPPVDREADAMLADLFTRYPEARYRITQTAFVQEAAIVEMQNRIRQLEWEVQNAQTQAQAAQQQQPRGMFGGMFGGGRPQQQQPMMPPPPQPQYPPGYNPQMLAPQGRGGGMGFFGTALAGAAGVAGGMMLGNALMGAFSGHHGAAAAASPFGGAGAAPDALTTASPWTDPSAAAADQGWGGGDKGYADSGKFGTPPDDSTPASWGGGGGGYDDGSSSGSSSGGGDWGGSSGGGDDYGSSSDDP